MVGLRALWTWENHARVSAEVRRFHHRRLCRHGTHRHSRHLIDGREWRRSEGYRLYTTVLPEQLEEGAQHRRQLLDAYYAACDGATVGFDFKFQVGCGVTEDDIHSYNQKAKVYNDTLARAKDLLYDPLTGQHHQGVARLAPLEIAALVY